MFVPVLLKRFGRDEIIATNRKTWFKAERNVLLGGIVLYVPRKRLCLSFDPFIMIILKKGV